MSKPQALVFRRQLLKGVRRPTHCFFRSEWNEPPVYFRQQRGGTGGPTLHRVTPSLEYGQGFQLSAFAAREDAATPSWPYAPAHQL